MISLLNFLSGVAEVCFWIGIGLFLFCLVGFALVMLCALILSAVVAAL